MKRRIFLQTVYSDYSIDVLYDLRRVYLVVNGKEYDYTLKISPDHPLIAKIGKDNIRVQFDRKHRSILFCGVRVLVNDVLVGNN